MFIILPEPGFEDLRVRPSNEEYLKRLREFVGDDSIPIHIKVWYSALFPKIKALTIGRMFPSGISTKSSLKDTLMATSFVWEMPCTVILLSTALVSLGTADGMLLGLLKGLQTTRPACLRLARHPCLPF